MTEDTNAAVMALARLACETGASFDVAYDANGDVRVNLYPQTIHIEGDDLDVNAIVNETLESIRKGARTSDHRFKL